MEKATCFQPAPWMLPPAEHRQESERLLTACSTLVEHSFTPQAGISPLTADSEFDHEAFHSLFTFSDINVHFIPVCNAIKPHTDLLSSPWPEVEVKIQITIQSRKISVTESVRVLRGKPGKWLTNTHIPVCCPAYLLILFSLFL